MVYNPQFLGIERTDGIVVIQITLASGRSVESDLFRRITDLLSSELQIRPRDVFINLVEVAPENRSFGNGEAQYALAPPPHLMNASA